MLNPKKRIENPNDISFSTRFPHDLKAGRRLQKGTRLPAVIDKLFKVT